MDRKTMLRRLDLVLHTGRLLMGNGADTSRTLRLMKRVALLYGLPEKNLHIYANYNMLMVNISYPEQSFTKFQRVEKHEINLNVIREMSILTVQAVRHNYSPEDFEHRLHEVERTRRAYRPWQVAVGGGLACGGFCVQFGGDWQSFVYASIAAILGLMLRHRLGGMGANKFVTTGVVAFAATLIAWLLGLFAINVPSAVPALSFLGSSTPWHPLMACALFIVPGVPLINFISDMLSEYVQVGITRAVNTFAIMLAMAFGIGLAIQVCGIDNFVRDLTMVPHHAYLNYMIAAAISAAGFSMIFNVPRRLVWVIAIGSIIAICTRNIVSLGPDSGNVGLGLGPALGTFAGSVLVSIMMCFIVRRMHTPHQCLAIPCVIPMVPGVLMYRALFAFLSMHGVIGEVTVAMNNAIQAFLIILCIALGVAIPNVFFRRMIYPLKERKLMELLLSRHQHSNDGMPDSAEQS